MGQRHFQLHSEVFSAEYSSFFACLQSESDVSVYFLVTKATYTSFLLLESIGAIQPEGSANRAY